MKLLEMFDTPIAGMQDVDQDNSKPTWKASRKTKLTLKQIRKLRKMLDVRKGYLSGFLASNISQSHTLHFLSVFCVLKFGY